MKLVVLIVTIVFSSFYGVCQKMKVAIPLGHTEAIKATAFSKNNRMLATSSDDNTIVLWDIATGTPFKKWYAGKDIVQLHFFNDTTLFYESRFTEIGFWNTLTQQKTHLDSISVNHYVIFNKEQKEVSIVYQSTCKGDFGFDAGFRIICYWPLTKKTFQFDIPYEKDSYLGLLCFAVMSDDGKYLAIGTSQGYIKVWNIESEQLIFENRINMDKHIKMWAKISHNNTLLAVSSGFNGNQKSGRVHIFNLETKHHILNKGIDNGLIDKLNFISNDSILVCYNTYPKDYPFVDVIDSHKGGQLNHLPTNGTSVTILPYTNTIAGIYENNDNPFKKEIRRYNVKSGKLLKSNGISKGWKIIASNDGKILLSIPQIESTLTLYDTHYLYPLRQLKGQVKVPREAYFLKREHLSLLINADMFFKWDLSNQYTSFPKPINTNLSPNSVYNPQSNTLIDVDILDNPLNIIIYDLESGKEIKKQTNEKKNLYSYPFISSSGNRFGLQIKGSQSPETIHRLWNIDSTNKITNAKTQNTNDFNITIPSISNNGKYFYFSNFSAIQTLIDLNSGNSINLESTEPNKNIYFFNFSFCNDEKIALLGYGISEAKGYDYSLGYWSLPTGNFIKKIANIPIEPKTINQSIDDKLIAVANDEGVIIIVNQTGKITHTFKGHNADVNSLHFSYDNQFLVSTSKDGTTKLWSLVNGEELASLLTFISGDWMLTTPEGYYFGTPGAASQLYFTRDSKLYSFEDFDLQYNRPDKVLERIGVYAEALIQPYRSAFQKRQERYPILNLQTTEDLPIVRFATSDSIPLDTEFTSIKIDITAESKDTSIESILVWVNGVPIFGSTNVLGRTENSKFISQRLDIELTEGNNIIQIGCKDIKGRYALRQTTNVFCRKAAIKPTIYFIGVGISKYKDSTNNLQYASKDIEDLKSMFEKVIEYRKTFADFKSIILQDSMATRENILKSKSLFAQIKPEDIVVLSFNGHGLLSKDLDFYFATYDTDFKSPDHTAIKYEEVEALLDSITARNRLILLDACHSGDVEKNGLINLLTKGSKTLPASGQRGIEIEESESQKIQSDFELMLSLFTNLNVDKGNTVFAASGGQGVAQEGGGINNGIFTYSLLEVLKADRVKISINELKTQVEEKVRNYTNGRQQPNFRRVNYKNNFFVPRP